MVAPILSGAAAKGARRFIRGTTRVQEVLGEHQDAVVAGHELAGLLAGDPHELDFDQAGRRVLDGQQEAAHAAREAFFDGWEKLDRKRSRRWFQKAASGE
jgi:hypothetical protein